MGYIYLVYLNDILYMSGTLTNMQCSLQNQHIIVHILQFVALIFELLTNKKNCNCAYNFSHVIMKQ